MLKISVLALSVMLSCSAALAAGHGMNHNAESNRQSISNQQNERPVTEMEYMQVQEVEIVEHNDANMPQEMQKNTKSHHQKHHKGHHKNHKDKLKENIMPSEISYQNM